MTREPVPDGYGQLLVKYGLTGLPSSPLLFRYRRGEALCREGESIEYLLYVVEGRVKVSTTAATGGKTLLMCFYKPGNVLGNIEALSDSRPATATAQAVADTACIAVHIASNQDCFRGSLPFLNHLCTELAAMFSRSSRNNAVNLLYPLQTRLCSYIHLTQEDGHFLDNLTQVSELLGTSYRHLHRTLDRLCGDGVLARAERGYRILDPTRLDRLAEDYYTF